MAQLAEHIREGMYTTEEAVPGALGVHGGGFVMNEEGECPSAAAIVEHCLHGKKHSVQSFIDSDDVLDGKFPNVKAPKELKELAKDGSVSRNVLHCLVRQYLAEEDAEAEHDDSDSDSDDFSDSSESEDK